MALRARSAVQKQGPGQSALADKAMLVRMTVHQWYSSVVDHSVTNEININKLATSKAGMYRKWLLPAEYGKRQRALENKLRRTHLMYTLPWSDDGYRVLKGSAYQMYMQAMREAKTEYLAFVDEMLVDYDLLKQNARAELGQMWNEADYPSPDGLRAKYGVDVYVLPIPSGQDFRVDVGDETREQIRREIESSTKATLQAGVKDMWGRIHDVVGKMVSTLDTYSDTDGERGFRESLVTNITKILDLVPALNIYDDPTVVEVANKVREKLTKHSSTVLKDDAKIRKDTAKEAAQILEQLSGFIA